MDLPLPSSAQRLPSALGRLEAEVVGCTACPRLVAWRSAVAGQRPRFADQAYWSRPVPAFGDPDAAIAIVGLAPAAHGANRTGRMFTGDRSGDWLFAALWRAGLAKSPESRSADDGNRLVGVWLTAAVRCAPPANRPSTEERDRCLGFLAAELAELERLSVIVALGHFAHRAVARLFQLRPCPRFAHGAEHPLGEDRWLLDSFHPSQQNTFTGRLTDEMGDAIFQRAKELATQ
jgi:uracil-DNA glycosylase family 4